MGVPVTDPEEERAVTSRVLRRVIVRVLVTAAALALLWWLMKVAPFYASLLRGVAIPVGAALAWWTWRAVRRASADRRAADRRRRARRTGAGEEPAGQE